MFKKSSSARVVMAVAAAAAVTFILFILGCANLPSNAAATVNGFAITKDDVADRIRLIAGMSPQKVPTDTESQEYKDMQRDITEQLVTEEVERQETDKRSLTVSADEINNIMDQVVEDKYLGSTDKMQADFDKRGLKAEDLRTQIMRQLLHQKLLESLGAEVPASEDEVRARYEASKDRYVYPEKRQVRQIVVADEATARAVSTRIASGEDFTAVAKAVSIDSRTKDNGGLVGVVAKNALPQVVGDVAFSQASGQVSMPFKSDLGWYIVKTELIAPASDQTFDQVKPDLTKYISNQHLVERYKQFAEELKSQYDIEYADDYSPREVQPGVLPTDNPLTSTNSNSAGTSTTP